MELLEGTGVPAPLDCATLLKPSCPYHAVCALLSSLSSFHSAFFTSFLLSSFSLFTSSFRHSSFILLSSHFFFFLSSCPCQAVSARLSSLSSFHPSVFTFFRLSLFIFFHPSVCTFPFFHPVQAFLSIPFCLCPTFIALLSSFSLHFLSSFSLHILLLSFSLLLSLLTPCSSLSVHTILSVPYFHHFHPVILLSSPHLFVFIYLPSFTLLCSSFSILLSSCPYHAVCALAPSLFSLHSSLFISFHPSVFTFSFHPSLYPFPSLHPFT